MTPPLGAQPHQRRYSVRRQARLDVETHAKLEELARTCQRKHAAILRFVMQWGLDHSTGWTIDRSPVVAVPPVPVLLAPKLLQLVDRTQTPRASRTIGKDGAPSLRLLDQQSRVRAGRTVFADGRPAWGSWTRRDPRGSC